VLVVAAAVLASALAAPPPPARADGDPASDVLASQSLFLPGDGGIPAGRQQQLAALLSSAHRAGYAIRVALIATPADLGSVTALWRRPAEYARFLYQELSLVYRGPVLVVMPNGFGLAAAGGGRASSQRGLAGGARASSQRALTGIAAPGSGAPLASAAILAVQRLAAAAGHPVRAPRPSSSGAHRSGSLDGGAWAALAAGLVLIAAAWTASLRSRPPGSGAHARDAEISTAS
jgi:hypothetical protein